MTESEPVDMSKERSGIDGWTAVIRPQWWKITVLSVLVGAVTFAWTLQWPDTYRATAIITPSVEEGKQSPAFGVLASYGISVGGPSKVEDLETLLRSGDLAIRIFRKYNAWQIVYPKRYNPVSGKLVPGWKERVLLRRDSAGRTPVDWDAIRASRKGLTIQTNRRNNTLTISFDAPSADGASAMVRQYLEEAKSRLQEEALERAARNKKFIEEQIGRTIDALSRDRLYSIYSQEVEREMMARNREQFGFRIIDAPRAPDVVHGPDRAGSAATGVFISMPFWIAVFLIGARKKRTLFPTGS